MIMTTVNNDVAGTIAVTDDGGNASKCAAVEGDDVLELYCTDDDYKRLDNRSLVDDVDHDNCTVTRDTDRNNDNDNRTLKRDDDHDNDDDDDDDGEDDGINIIINNNLMSDNYNSYVNDVIQEDLELNIEIKKLINESVKQRGYYDRAVVTLYAQDTTIPISTDTVISSRLVNHVWGTEYPYKQFDLKNSECFNAMLQKYRCAMNELSLDGDDYVAFFATIYENMQKNNNGVDQRTSSTNTALMQNRCKNLHFFKKFAIIVLRHGKFVDAAIHGRYSNITDVLKKYKPTRVYCSGSEHDTIDAFLKFKYQPFYNELSGRVRYIGTTLIRNQTSVMFCSQNLRFCAFCRAIDTILTYYTNLQQQRLIPTIISDNYKQQQQQQPRQWRLLEKNKRKPQGTRRAQNLSRGRQEATRSLPGLRQLVESFKIPCRIPYYLLNNKPRMRFIKHKRLSHRM